MALSQPSPSPSHSHLPQVSANHLDPLQTASPALKDHTVVQSSPTLVVAASSGRALSDLSNRQINNLKHHQPSLSSSSSKQNRGALFTLAALARDKTTNAIASLSEPSIRSRQSSSSLYRSAQSSPTSPSNNSNSLSKSADSQTSTQDNTASHNSSRTSSSTHTRSETQTSSTTRQSLLETDPPSQAYSNTAADTPAPIVLHPHRSDNYNKMHQTSSRLLRMTSDDRPFTRVRKTNPARLTREWQLTS
jgi:GTPase-activating protein SST2